MYYGERFNSITHLVGAALATAGSTLLLVVAIQLEDPWKIFSFSIYGAMLITLYVTSTLYHSLRGPAKDVMRMLDYCAIYLMIAGSYTPFALVSLRDSVGWFLFCTVWTAAVIGVLQEIWLAKSRRMLALAIYVVMGWLALAAINPLVLAIGWSGFIWALTGGLLYTIGIAFFVNDEKLRHGHGMWHLFVLAGSICHYITVLYYVA
jgi:hemolysin III